MRRSAQPRLHRLLGLAMPSLEFENIASTEIGSQLIAGLDEAGRGAIAGPVVAASVILPLEQPELIARLGDVNDSKQISPIKRESLYDVIVELALTYGVGSATPDEIDRFGIIGATVLAMERAAEQLKPQAVYLLIDGRIRLIKVPLPQRSIIRGDCQSLSIAAASILAKVTRDRMMLDQEDLYPDYGFARHKGYCTAIHVEALFKHGPCPIHRHSFAPIRQTLI